MWHDFFSQQHLLSACCVPGCVRLGAGIELLVRHGCCPAELLVRCPSTCKKIKLQNNVICVLKGMPVATWLVLPFEMSVSAQSKAFGVFDIKLLFL